MTLVNRRAAEPTLFAASVLAKAGYPVFPVGPDKSPSVEGGFYAGTTDVAEVEEWINEGREHHDVAFATGLPSGVVVMDTDTPEATAEMEAKYGEPTVQTNRGGHWYFRHPHNGKVTSNNVRDGLDRKGDGGYAVAPPSRGRAWTNGIPDRMRLPILPREFWPKKAEKSNAPRSLPPERKERAAEVIARHVVGIPAGGRHEHLRHLCGVLLAREVPQGDAEDILIGAWSKVGGDLADRAEREVPNTLRTTAQAIAEGRATGVPKLEKTTPGLYAELEEVFDWRANTTHKGRSGGEELEDLPIPKPHPWPVMDEEAYYGLAGDIVRAIDPHTEADPVAVLANLLCAFGNAIGRAAYFQVGADGHHLKFNVGIVGETSKGRKGMSEGHVRQLMHAVDPAWEEERVMSGLSSGEGLIHEVRDEVWGLNSDGEEVLKDPGAPDKRLQVSEPELARVLKVMTRETNTLSPIVRQAWDSGRLRVMTRTNPLKATDAHISIVGHISKQELLRHLTQTEVASGFANRFLWLMVRRSKELPFGGEWHTVDTTPLVKRLSEALEFAQSAGEITWGESAKPAWREAYGPLSEGKPGLFGAVVGRAEAQTMRLAALYAVLDLSKSIEFEHLVAALALWDYAEASARYIFGDATGDPVADQTLEALRASGSEGMSRTEIRDLFGRHKSTDRINQALVVLSKLGHVRCVREATNGRPSERWFPK